MGRPGGSVEGVVIRLRSVKYAEWEGTSQEWKLEGISLGHINLIVGKNASGKTRILNIISGLAGQLAGGAPLPLSGEYDARFLDDGKDLRYQLKYADQQVTAESFSVGDEVLLQRGHGGTGEIFAEEVDEGKKIR